MRNADLADSQHSRVMNGLLSGNRWCWLYRLPLVDALIGDGHSVRVLDNLTSGSLKNIPVKAVLIKGDITDPEIVAQALEGVDGCFHLAAIASVEQ